jgi:hypothetical protein
MEQIELIKLEMYGSQQGPATAWMYWAGYGKALLSNGKTIQTPEHPKALEFLKAQGIDTTRYLQEIETKKLKSAFPPIPHYAEYFQHNYGKEKPTKIHSWQWSTTFNRWSALVTFQDGWHGYTYPELKNDDPWYFWIEENKQHNATPQNPCYFAYAPY